MQYAEALASEMEHIHTAILIYSSLYYDSNYKIKKAGMRLWEYFQVKIVVGCDFDSIYHKTVYNFF